MNKYLDDNIKDFIIKNRLDMTISSMSAFLNIPYNSILAFLKRKNLPYRRMQSSSSDLTQTEKEILELMAQGLSNKEIKEKRCITQSTLSVHLRNIYIKFDIHTPQAITGDSSMRVRAVLKYLKRTGKLKD